MRSHTEKKMNYIAKFFILSIWLNCAHANDNMQSNFSHLENIAQEEGGNYPIPPKKESYDSSESTIIKSYQDVEYSCKKLDREEQKRLYELLLSNLNFINSPRTSSSNYIPSKLSFSKITEIENHFDRNIYKINFDHSKLFQPVMKALEELDKLLQEYQSKTENKIDYPSAINDILRNYAFIMDPVRLSIVLKEYFSFTQVTLNAFGNRDQELQPVIHTGNQWAEIIIKGYLNYDETNKDNESFLLIDSEKGQWGEKLWRQICLGGVFIPRSFSPYLSGIALTTDYTDTRKIKIHHYEKIFYAVSLLIFSENIEDKKLLLSYMIYNSHRIKKYKTEKLSLDGFKKRFEEFLEIMKNYSPYGTLQGVEGIKLTREFLKETLQENNEIYIDYMKDTIKILIEGLDKAYLP